MRIIILRSRQGSVKLGEVHSAGRGVTYLEPLTERCLQGHSLPFVGSNHTIRYLDGRPDLQIPARDVDKGTFPEGSVWRLNPVRAFVAYCVPHARSSGA